VRDLRYLILRDELLFSCPDDALRVDLDAFEGAAVEARRSGEPASYRRALDPYNGDLLPQDRYEEWAEERRTGLRQEYQTLLSELATIYERATP
jgi:DNA-binding SARP family transcriptional activator